MSKFNWFSAAPRISTPASASPPHLTSTVPTTSTASPTPSTPFSTPSITSITSISTTTNRRPTADEGDPPSSSSDYQPGPLLRDLSSSPSTCSQPTTPSDAAVCSYLLSSSSNLISRKMPTTSSPIDIATPTRLASSSPSSQGHQTDPKFLEPDSRTSAAMLSAGGFESSMGGSGRHDSFVGAKPISMNNPNRNGEGRLRRESLAGSLAGGMSWGGVSVGSWVRDDIMMTGTSPFPMQSPSYHSASYMPKLEANFMRDFACCGQNLATLHDLLQHYEECHAQQTPQSLRNSAAAQRARDNPTPNSKAAIASQTSSSVQQQAQQQQNHSVRSTGLQVPQGAPPVGGISLLRQQPLSQPATPVQKNFQPMVDDGMEGVEDMEMDDGMGPMDQAQDSSNQQKQQPVQSSQQSLFGQQPRSQANVNNGMQFSGLRTSQPTTPAGFGFQHNPTVSSVNTPTLTTHQQQNFSPHSSVPGTPAGELEDDFSTFPLNLNMGAMSNLNQTYPYGYGGNDMGLDLCIDEPARRLYQPNGGGQQSQRAMQQQFAQFGLGQGQFANNDPVMRAYQQQGMIGMNGMAPNAAVMAAMMAEEHKPFRCPVIGCEKAYKNQNGLKYHKTHGHQTQQLHENGDGTFSIVNPETSIPYQGEAGMAKEKPYRCEVCGKRYKNLNGLKYHKLHSMPCNPELKLNNHMAAVGLHGLGVNVAGLPGLPGIGEENMM